ncbi:hypothetical protein [Frankia sp. QA3]|uniref:hypothetical protein n=1 Tax=Frankia sp. QA3 TaxID=710111 RepID=UPI000269BC84|nr:hypothetical protein [Frankia sp. QA3]EIV92698.1 hypothetical protein FraQA3DRAFT_2308 [Frankia sp. QA3]
MTFDTDPHGERGDWYGMGDEGDVGVRSEVLLIRVWRVSGQAGRMTARLLCAGERNDWTATSMGATTDPTELSHLVDVWLQDFLRG